MTEHPDALEAMLTAPLPSAPDNGFSAKVMMKIEERQSLRAALAWLGISACFLVGLAFLPWLLLVKEAFNGFMALLAQPGLYVAVLAIILTYVMDRPGKHYK